MSEAERIKELEAEIADLIVDVEKRGETIVNLENEVERLRKQLAQSNSDWPMRRRG
jgi:predicted  nucleic acid-binding Zn-ribbon protein